VLEWNIWEIQQKQFFEIYLRSFDSLIAAAFFGCYWRTICPRTECAGREMIRLPAVW